MGFLLTLLGILALLFSLAGIGLGAYMATNPNTRELGGLFSLWWVPAVAAASGILMRDLVTFVVGMGCFLFAGLVFVSTSIVMRNRRARPLDRRDEGSAANVKRPRNRKTAS